MCPRADAVALLGAGHTDLRPLPSFSCHRLGWVRWSKRKRPVVARIEGEAVRMQTVCPGLGGLPCPEVLVAEMHDDAIAHLALDDRTRDRSHCALVGRVGLVEVPGIDLPIVRRGPVHGVTTQD